MKVDSMMRRASALGNEQATHLLKVRNKALKRREEGLKKKRKKKKVMMGKKPVVSPALMKSVGSLGTGEVLVAEGDSWFDYPWNDILSLLEDEHGYDVESVANKGDRVEEMAYIGGQLTNFVRRIEKLLRRGVIPKAILLSGGGNDVAGDDFHILLNHASSPNPGLNGDILTGIIDHRIKYAYITILSAVTRICEERLGRKIRILTHGYDYPVPDGRGFWGGWLFLPGPWLEPGFREKGYEDMKARMAMTKKIIDRFNEMLLDLSKLSMFSHVKHVDLRGTLPTGPTYKKWWDNELHPTELGFSKVTAQFAQAI